MTVSEMIKAADKIVSMSPEEVREMLGRWEAAALLRRIEAERAEPDFEDAILTLVLHEFSHKTSKTEQGPCKS